MIVQTSVKTSDHGVDVLYAMWRELTAGIDGAGRLHLDHCPDRAVISDCLARAGTRSSSTDAAAG